MVSNIRERTVILAQDPKVVLGDPSPYRFGERSILASGADAV
jgi:hypothetical protein